MVGFGVNSNTGIVYAAGRLGCIPCPPDNLHGLVTLISGTQVITSIAMSTAPYATGVNSATGHVYLLDTAVNPDYSSTSAIKVLSGTQVITVAGSERSLGLPMYGNIRANPTTGYVYAARANDLTILSGTQVITNLPLSIPWSALHRACTSGRASGLGTARDRKGV